ncbi:MAG TPA: hypothetical protein VGE40_06595, partial [Bacilli bacterium]
DGAPVYNAVSVVNGQVDSVTLTFAPDTYDNYYNLGTLKGVDEQALSFAINNYGRWMIQDTRRGASTEASIMKSEVPAIEMQWIGQMMEVFGTPQAISSFKYGLEDIKNYLIEADTGKILCCRPGSSKSAHWGVNYRDQAAGYALGVSKAYILDGNTTWLQGMKGAVEGGLDYVINNYMNTTTKLMTNIRNTDDTIYDNDYWESSTGTYNGYASALFYDALVQWAKLERFVLGDTTKAAAYENIAATLKTNFNLDLSSGGFWSPATNSFYYGTGNRDVRHLPTQGEVLKSDIATNARKKLMVQGGEGEVYANKANHHYMNYNDLYVSGAAATCGKIGENGGWYPVVEGDYFAGFPVFNDRLKIPVYIGNFLNRYYENGFYDSSAWHRNTPTQGCGAEYWFPNAVMPAWGLYAYGYGFQPQYNELIIAPFISPNMTGSIVNYTWRTQPITVTYTSQTNFSISASSLPTNIRVRWINQTPGSTYSVSVDGGAGTSVTADSNGNVDVIMGTTGTHSFHCTTCLVSSVSSSGSSFVTAVNLSGGTLRSDVTEQVGMKITVGGSPITVQQLGRYYVSGNNKIHTLKLVNSAGTTLATTSVDMSQGTADSLGFKYGGLSTPITLAANTSYYIYSLELKGGDIWYNNTISVSTTSAATVNNSSYGDRIINGSTGNTYGPVNFKY